MAASPGARPLSRRGAKKHTCPRFGFAVWPGPEPAAWQPQRQNKRAHGFWLYGRAQRSCPGVGSSKALPLSRRGQKKSMPQCFAKAAPLRSPPSFCLEERGRQKNTPAFCCCVAGSKEAARGPGPPKLCSLAAAEQKIKRACVCVLLCGCVQKSCSLARSSKAMQLGSCGAKQQTRPCVFAVWPTRARHAQATCDKTNPHKRRAKTRATKTTTLLPGGRMRAFRVYDDGGALVRTDRCSALSSRLSFKSRCRRCHCECCKSC